MCRFIETIRLENGEVRFPEDHEKRMNATREHFWPGEPPLRLADYIQPEPMCGRVRCRVTYGREIQRVEYFAYHPRMVRSLQCVETSGVDYHYKYADRSVLDALFARRGDADDVLLFNGGLLTDTSIANVALWNGSEWHTPEIPLLEGTHRSRLLRNGLLKPRTIRLEDLPDYQSVTLFNAMLDFGEVQLPVSAIHTEPVK